MSMKPFKETFKEPLVAFCSEPALQGLEDKLSVANDPG